jgi:hypothetical protein
MMDVLEREIFLTKILENITRKKKFEKRYTVKFLERAEKEKPRGKMLNFIV